MPRQKRPWFRCYVEMFGDPKIRRHPPAHRWIWVAIMGAARESPRPGILMLSDEVPMSDADIADYAAVSRRDVTAALASFHRLGMIEVDSELEAWRVTHFNERQFESDDTAKRTAKHRSKERSNEHDRNVPTSTVGTSKPQPKERSPSRGRVPAPVRAPTTETETEGGGTFSEQLGGSRSSESPPRCAKHAHIPAGQHVPDCGACAELRRAHQASRPPPKPAEVAELERTGAAQRAKAERAQRIARGERCQSCDGIGYVSLDETHVDTCDVCDGSGMAPPDQPVNHETIPHDD